MVAGEHTGARATADEEARLVGSLGDGATELAALTAAAGRLTSGLPGIENVSGISLFIDPIDAAPQLVIIGAVEIAIHLARLAKIAGYRVVVIDPRRTFLTEERIPDADLLLPQWPDEALPGLVLGPRDAAVCLAHDPKFEDPALGVLLRSRVGYVGAIGSRSTHAKRVTRLQQEGLSALAVSQIHSPSRAGPGRRHPSGDCARHPRRGGGDPPRAIGGCPLPRRSGGAAVRLEIVPGTAIPGGGVGGIGALPRRPGRRRPARTGEGPPPRSRRCPDPFPIRP